MLKKAVWIILIIIISGVSAIIADRYVFPRLSNADFFSRNKFLKNFTTDVTIINKTEQIYVKEDSSVAKLAANISSSIVNIISYSASGIDAGVFSKISENPIIHNSTGLIVASDGLIMTYIETTPFEDTKYKIISGDGNSYDAELLSVDSYSNLAFLKINASNLPTISFGNSDDFQAGEKVVAVGNNLGNYQNRFAQGLLNDFNSSFNISGAAVSTSEKMEGVFEADMKMEDGFVGSPVVDYSGQTIAVTGATIKNNEAVYFLIPANKVQAVIQKTIKQETKDNAKLGIYYLPITKTLFLANSLPVEKGALIFSASGQQGLAIIANSSAAKAGLKINDIITSVSGQEISANNTLPDILYKYKKGDAVELTVLRDGQEMKIKVEL
jgi:serine protease Do